MRLLTANRVTKQLDTEFGPEGWSLTVLRNLREPYLFPRDLALLVDELQSGVSGLAQRDVVIRLWSQAGASALESFCLRGPADARPFLLEILENLEAGLTTIGTAFGALDNVEFSNVGYRLFFLESLGFAF